MASSSSPSTRRLATLVHQVARSVNNNDNLVPIVPQLTAASLSDDDIVIVGAVRTPIGKANRGGFKDTHWTDLLGTVLKEVVKRGGLEPGQVEDVQVGTVLAKGGGANEARIALYLSDFPDEVAVATTNRQCSSGLQAFANIAAAIKNNHIKIGIAAGVESMSQNAMMSGVPDNLNEKTFSNQRAAQCLTPMGITSENVAERFGVDRKKQDMLAYESHRKAAIAQREGKFRDEIVPVSTTVKDSNGNVKSITVSQDEGIRSDTTLEGLAKLKPAFKQSGTTTAGNSSQVSDGAAAVLVTTRREAKRLGLKILGSFLSFAVVGVPPDVMGIGPAFAIPKALEKAGLTINDIDSFELNEAFASQAVYCVEKLGIPLNKLNPLGGAIALGHPLGCTGARQIATLLYHLKRENMKYGVVSMCIGTGMGAAAVFRAE